MEERPTPYPRSEVCERCGRPNRGDESCQRCTAPRLAALAVTAWLLVPGFGLVLYFAYFADVLFYADRRLVWIGVALIFGGPFLVGTIGFARLIQRKRA